jgi:hypothetical protein
MLRKTEHRDTGKDSGQIETLRPEGTGGKDQNDFKQRKPGSGRYLPNQMKTRVARPCSICCMGSVEIDRQCYQSL